MMFVMFVVKYDSTQELDISQMFDQTKGDPEAFLNAFKNPIYKKAVETWLPFLDKRGFLDTFLPNAPVTPFVQGILDTMPKFDAPGPPKSEE